MVFAPSGCCLTVVSGMGSTGGACVRGSASNLAADAVYTTAPLFGIASADLNGDGLLDLVTTQYVEPQPSGFLIFFGLPDGGLSAPVHQDGASGHALALGDLDGDGSPDLVISNLGTSGIQVLLNDGTGALLLQAPVATARQVEGIAIGDLNGDGVADLLLAEYNGTLPSAELAFGTGSGSFSAAVALPNLGGTQWGGVLIADLNQDGLADIAASAGHGGPLAVLLNQGDGGFETTNYSVGVMGQIALLPGSSGAPDLILGNADPNAFFDGGANFMGVVQLMRNSGRGIFSVGHGYTAPGGLTLAIGDFNGDCIPDIATSGFGATLGVGAPTWGISVLYGDEQGGFEPAVSLQATSQTPGFLSTLGPVASPRALAVSSTGLTVYGDASRH